MKIAVVTDSNSGIREKEAKELGIYLVPMPFIIEEKVYFEGVNLTEEFFYEKLEGEESISTSQPAPGDVLALWNRLLKDYDQIVHIPMSSGLSNSCATAKMLAEDYPGKVFVADTKRISATQRQAVKDALALMEAGMDGAQIQKRLEEHGLEASIYIAVDTLKYLRKGGRITPAVAALGTVLHIKPVMEIQGGKLDMYAKARGQKNMRRKLIEAVQKDRAERFAGRDVKILMAYSGTKEVGEQWLAEVSEAFPGDTIEMEQLGYSICCHTGPGALGVGCVLIEEERKLEQG